MGETQRHDGYHLISEYIDTQKEVDRLDAIIEEKQAEIEEKQRQVEKLVRHQEELALVLGPALRKSGPVAWKDGYTTYLVEEDANEMLLNVVKLESPLAVKLPQFTDEQIRESIGHDMAADFAMSCDDDDDDDDETEVISLPGRQALIAHNVAVIDQEAG